ncbi:MAG: adenine phosphoribosyltransferase [Alphaproteobacteria bacterium]|nr:adenine phosphoribosyltransferase [Alphaproteobacteria bacterium]
MNLKNYIAEIPNFPVDGILFYDISPLLADNTAWGETVEQCSKIVSSMKPTTLVALESRGFFLAGAIALKLNLGFVMVRKKGKLPGELYSYSYDLEYGQDTLEIKKDILKSSDRVVILDDLLATGGTLNASEHLIKQSGAQVVGAVCILELVDLGGRAKCNFNVETLLKY